MPLTVSYKTVLYCFCHTFKVTYKIKGAVHKEQWYSKPVSRNPSYGSPRTIRKQTFTLRFVTVQNYSYEVATKIILWLGVTTTWGTVLKGCSIRKVESHWYTPFQTLSVKSILQLILSTQRATHLVLWLQDPTVVWGARTLVSRSRP